MAIEQLVLEEHGWEAWVRRMWPQHFAAGFAPFHREMWEWVWSIDAGVQPDPSAFVGVWSRDFAKSTNAETGTVSLGARGRRRYALYVCSTQDRADQHVGTTISGLFESEQLERLYPAFSRRLVSKYGHSRGWKVNRLRTETGFTIDALGLDAAVRGVKIDEVRPDLIVLDDIDEPLDSELVVLKKVEILTRNILPAAGPGVAVVAVQNLIHPRGVFARLAGLMGEDEPFAEFLTNRRLSGPIPALEGAVIRRLAYINAAGEERTKATIVAGTPTWPQRKSVEVLQADLDRTGETPFRMEYLHNVDRLEGAMFTKALESVRVQTVAGIDGLKELVATLDRTTVWCDPAITDKDASDSHGVQADGLHANGDLYRLHSWERRASPREALKRAILWSYELGSGHVGVETDQGGDTWFDSFELALGEVLAENPELSCCIRCGQPPARHDDDGERDGCAGGLLVSAHPMLLTEKAGTGHGPKQERGQRMLTDVYEADGPPVVHVYGYPDDSTALDSALGRVFVRKPFDLADAAYWSAWYLLTSGEGGTGLEAAGGGFTRP